MGKLSILLSRGFHLPVEIFHLQRHYLDTSCLESLPGAQCEYVYVVRAHSSSQVPLQVVNILSTTVVAQRAHVPWFCSEVQMYNTSYHLAANYWYVVAWLSSDEPPGRAMFAVSPVFQSVKVQTATHHTRTLLKSSGCVLKQHVSSLCSIVTTTMT